MILPNNVPVIPQPSTDYLTDRQRVDYHEHREEWCPVDRRIN